ncbi:hypothetical protein HKD37_08G022334 [Glycine soja]
MDDLHRLRYLSSLLHQIDELVVQAIEVNYNNNKTISKEGKTQIESFSRVLSDMLSSLEPWVPKIQKALNPQNTVSDDETIECDSPEETTLNLVSPSPLVSWRANCTVERGRQMFMLTPLPLSSKHHQPKPHFPPPTTSSTTTFKDSVMVKPTPIKQQLPNNQDGSMLLMMTPCLKMSPPRSCLLLEPISEISRLGDRNARKGTPYPVGIHCSDSESSSSDDSSRDLSLMYPELLGIHKSGIGKKTVEASPDWFTSPPKTCVLLEPPDEKIDDHLCVQIADSILNEQVSKFEDDDVSKDHDQAKKSCNQDNFVGNLSHVKSTPMPESSFQTGKCPGENTLKKELWTKFEAASTWGCQPKVPTGQKSAHKGFLDLLEEASCDE